MSVRPTIANTPEMVDSVNRLILVNRGVITRNTSKELGIYVEKHTKLCMMIWSFQKSLIFEFQHENTKPHTAAKAMETISQFG